MKQELKSAYLDFLMEMITTERLQKMQEVLAWRTKYLTVVVEDIYQPHNASAVLRSCDCFGVLDVHIIENRNAYQVNPDVALGASKWLNLHRYNQQENNSLECIRNLKRSGYRVVATSSHKDECSLEDMPMDQKTALVFGNEVEGISPIVMQEADAFMMIPMVGFTESLNISVSVAITIHTLSNKLRNGGYHWQLSEEDRRDTLIHWIQQTVKKPEQLQSEFLKRFPL